MVRKSDIFVITGELRVPVSSQTAEPSDDITKGASRLSNDFVRCGNLSAGDPRVARGKARRLFRLALLADACAHYAHLLSSCSSPS